MEPGALGNTPTSLGGRWRPRLRLQRRSQLLPAERRPAQRLSTSLLLLLLTAIALSGIRDGAATSGHTRCRCSCHRKSLLSPNSQHSRDHPSFPASEFERFYSVILGQEGAMQGAEEHCELEEMGNRGAGRWEWEDKRVEGGVLVFVVNSGRGRWFLRMGSATQQPNLFFFFRFQLLAATGRARSLARPSVTPLQLRRTLAGCGRSTVTDVLSAGRRRSSSPFIRFSPIHYSTLIMIFCVTRTN